MRANAFHDITASGLLPINHTTSKFFITVGIVGAKGLRNTSVS